jgi:multimeric flavodoxin WrbA
MPDAIALFASSRRNGNTGQFLDRIARDLSLEIVDLSSQRISQYDYEHRNRDDDFEPLMRRVLSFDKIILASPVYWYAVSPPMKIFLDRITDYLDLPDLLDDGRRLRGKTGYVVATSIYDEVPKSFLGSLTDSFDYLGMRFGGVAHANCKEGGLPANHEVKAAEFAQIVKGTAARAASEAARID